MNARLAVTTFLSLIVVGPATAQVPSAAGRTFELSALQQAAIASDPRMRQLDLLMQQSDLRLRNIAAGRLPAIMVEGQAQYQSDVPTPPMTLPSGQPLFLPPKGTVDSGLRLDQRLFDTTLGALSAVERAQLAEQQARIRTTLFALRQQVNDAFFAAAALQARAGALAASVAGLDGRLQEMNARVAQGTAFLPTPPRLKPHCSSASRTRTNCAPIARRRWRDSRSSPASRSAAPTCSRFPTSGRSWRAPNRRRRPAAPVPNMTSSRARGKRLVKQAELSSAQERPRISAFAKVGYGRPGLNFIGDGWDTYGLGGVRLQWNAWTWGSGAREREALAIGQQVIAADQDAFDKGLREATETDRAAIDRLQHALVVDERIVALREQVTQSAQIRLQEGVVTSSNISIATRSCCRHASPGQAIRWSSRRPAHGC
jgi:outer membrane protein TolC